MARKKENFVEKTLDAGKKGGESVLKAVGLEKDKRGRKKRK